MEEKKCFVIMPISDCSSYSDGHFNRVYEHLIKPACEKAGFKPVRADDIMTTNYIALDIIKHIINSEMAICDLSNKNPNVLYELGIRQAFNLPVTLIKDSKTNRMFDIQGFRDVEYDESLRIDTVQDTIGELSEIIKNTYLNTFEINSLVSLLGIQPAKITEKKEISLDTEIILSSIQGIERRLMDFEIKTNVVSKNIHNSEMKNNALLLGEVIKEQEFDNLKSGEEIFHTKFGKGKIVAINKRGENPKNYTASINFEIAGIKNIMLRFALLRRILN